MIATSRRRKWSHKSVRALIRAAGGGDPEAIIRQKARDLVAWAKQHGWTGPPYEPLVLASLRGIKTKATAQLFSAEAQLTPVRGRQLILEFNPDRSAGRKNFSICHEIAHTLFDDCFEMVRQRRAEPDRYGPESEVEQLCQIAAAEILMPEEDFGRDLKRGVFSMHMVRPLMDRYAASREAILRRMVAFSNRPSAVVFLSKRLCPSEKRRSRQRPVSGDESDAPVPKMRILYAVTTTDFPVFLPPHKSVPDTSCVCQASGVDRVSESVERWDLPGFGAWHVQATVLPVPFEADDDTPSVAALVLPNRSRH